MSVKLTKEKAWFSSKWVTLKLFEDSLRFLELDTNLGKKIFFLNKVSIDALDLSEFDVTNQKLFSTTIDRVLDYNNETKGADMHDASYFLVYIDKLQSLKEMLKNV